MAPFTPSSTAPCLAFDANTVVVITGTSRGLGLHLVSYILETTRSQVVATARNIDKAAQLRELAAKFEGRAMLVELDTEDPASVKARARTHPPALALGHDMHMHIVTLSELLSVYALAMLLANVRCVVDYATQSAGCCG